MISASKEVIDKIIEINKKISNKYSFLSNMKEKVLESIKKSKSLTIRQMRELMENEIVDISRGKGIVGVDGSINTVGSSYPHYLSVMQSLAKCTNRNYKDILLADVHTPLLEEEALFIDQNISPQDRDEKLKAAKMAKLELEAAIKACEQMDVSIIMMDGSLIRYKINCGKLWDEFVEKVLNNNIYVIGIIEEIKTKELSKILDIFENESFNMFDREILFGTIEEGQMLIINESKDLQGFKKCFMRTSRDPHVIGMDMLEQQADMLNSLADLVYTLTTTGGRGIPLWLDIVDSEVKISDKFVNSLIESYIQPDIRRRIFTAKRDYRTL